MRHEFKHILNLQDFLIIKSRLDKILAKDNHINAHGNYRVRSLYFDSPSDRALMDKVNGVNRREKFRIRYYDKNLDYIRLEKKIKINGLCSKKTAIISQNQVESLLNKDYDFLLKSDEDLFKEVYSKIYGQLLAPKVIVDYIRTPYVYLAGNVRITLDHDIRSSLMSTDFLNTDSILFPTTDEYGILEVKYDNYIPDFIKALVHTDRRPTSAFSKYAAARKFD